MQSSEDEPVYVISVAARLAGLKSWELRVLDQEGVVVPARTDSNRRLYSDNDITRLVRAHDLLQKGVNVEGIKIILTMERQLEEARRGGTPVASGPAPEPIAPPPPPRNGNPSAAPANGVHVNPVEELALALPEVESIVSPREGSVSQNRGA